jgi:hypothetical protein
MSDGQLRGSVPVRADSGVAGRAGGGGIGLGAGGENPLILRYERSVAVVVFAQAASSRAGSWLATRSTPWMACSRTVRGARAAHRSRRWRRSDLDGAARRNLGADALALRLSAIGA